MATTTTHNTYGAPVSVPLKNTIGGKTGKVNGLVYPLTGSFKKVTGSPPVLQNNTSEGGYFSKGSGIDLVRNNLRQLLSCEKGERVMLPNYGISMRKFLFEPLDETTYFLVRTEVLRTLNTYFSSVNVISLAVYAANEQREQGKLTVSLTLQLKDESLEVFDTDVVIA